MAVCRQDMLYKDNTSNPIPTSFFLYLRSLYVSYATRLLGIVIFEPKKRCRDGVTCVTRAFARKAFLCTRTMGVSAPSLHRVYRLSDNRLTHPRTQARFCDRARARGRLGTQARFCDKARARGRLGTQARFCDKARARGRLGTQARFCDKARVRGRLGTQARFCDKARARGRLGTQARFCDKARARGRLGTQARFCDKARVRGRLGTSSSRPGLKSTVTCSRPTQVPFMPLDPTNLVRTQAFKAGGAHM